MANDLNPKRRSGFGLAVIALAVTGVIGFEGTSLRPYEDPVRVNTICMGETDRDVVAMGTLTLQQCTAVLGASLQEHASHVAPCISRPVRRNEAAAILSWSYNIGATAACKSTLIRKLNDGAQAVDWCDEIKRWTYAGGKQLPGLVARRESEYRMCTTGVWK